MLSALFFFLLVEIVKFVEELSNILSKDAFEVMLLPLNLYSQAIELRGCNSYGALASQLAQQK